MVVIPMEYSSSQFSNIHLHMGFIYMCYMTKTNGQKLNVSSPLFILCKN